MKKTVAVLLLFTSACLQLFANGSTQVFAKYRARYFIETGSYLGDGIQQALDAGFREVHSIELSPKYVQHCRTRFVRNKQVHIWPGDSSIVLGQVLQQIKEPATFWLDGHYSRGDTARGETMTPLLKELEIIKNHSIKTHTILIDDVRCCGTELFDYVTLDTIIAKLKEINPDYTILFEDGYAPKDILVAQVQSAL